MHKVIIAPLMLSTDASVSQMCLSYHSGVSQQIMDF